jgi:hypothetical protein
MPDAEGADSPAYFRVRLKEEFERTLRYKRPLTLALLALEDLEEPGKPGRAPHESPALAYVPRAIRTALRRTDLEIDNPACPVPGRFPPDGAPGPVPGPAGRYQPRGGIRCLM